MSGRVWEPGGRRWLIERLRINPVIRALQRRTDPLFRRAGISLGAKLQKARISSRRSSQIRPVRMRVCLVGALVYPACADNDHDGQKAVEQITHCRPHREDAAISGVGATRALTRSRKGRRTRRAIANLRIPRSGMRVTHWGSGDSTHAIQIVNLALSS
jgi:hypothetical protein